MGLKKCNTCTFGYDYELDKPCIVYREDCPLYQKVGDGMSREEAIQVLRHIVYVADTSVCGNKEIDGTDEEALDMAIKALENISHITDRPCDVCEFHTEQGCTQWKCVFCDELFGSMR